jgi:hypothetical protein
MSDLILRRRYTNREVTGPTPEELQTGAFSHVVAGFFPDIPGRRVTTYGASGNQRYAGLPGWSQDALPDLASAGVDVGGWRHPERYVPGRYDFAGRGVGYQLARYLGPKYARDQGYRGNHYDSYGGQNYGVGEVPVSGMADLTWSAGGPGRGYTPQPPARTGIGNFWAADGGYDGVFLDAPFGPKVQVGSLVPVGSLVDLNWVPGAPGQGHNWNRYTGGVGRYRRSVGFNAGYGDSYGPNYGVGALDEPEGALRVQLAVKAFLRQAQLPDARVVMYRTEDGDAFAVVRCSAKFNDLAASIAESLKLGAARADNKEDHFIAFATDIERVLRQAKEEENVEGEVLQASGAPIGALASASETESREEIRQARLASRVAAAASSFFNWAHDQQFEVLGRFKSLGESESAASGYGIMLYDAHERAEAHQRARRIAKRHGVFYRIISGEEAGMPEADESASVVYFSGDPSGVLVTAAGFGSNFRKQFAKKLRKLQGRSRRRARDESTDSEQSDSESEDDDTSAGRIHIGALRLRSRSSQRDARRDARRASMQTRLQSVQTRWDTLRQKRQERRDQRKERWSAAMKQRRENAQQRRQNRQQAQQTTTATSPARRPASNTPTQHGVALPFPGYGYGGGYSDGGDYGGGGSYRYDGGVNYGSAAQSQSEDQDAYGGYYPTPPRVIVLNAPLPAEDSYEEDLEQPEDDGMLPPLPPPPPGYIYTPDGQLVPIGLVDIDLLAASRPPQTVGYDPMGNPIIAGVPGALVVGSLPVTPRSVISKPGVNFQYPL